jgi:hypothetical protein
MRRAERMIMAIILQPACPPKHKEWNKDDYKYGEISKECQEDRVQLRRRNSIGHASNDGVIENTTT